MRNVLVLGGGAAGGTATKILHESLEGRKNVQLRLIDRRPQAVIRLLLPDVVVGEHHPRTAIIDLSEQYGAEGLEILLDQVTQIDLERGRVKTDHREFNYDYLLIALGSEPNVPDWWPRDSQDHHVLHTDIDATRLNHRLQKEFFEEGSTPKRIAVIGAGPVGVALAGRLADWNADQPTVDHHEILLFEREYRLLPDFPAEFAIYCRAELEQNEVELHLDSEVSGCTDTGLEVNDGQVDVDLTIWAGGVQPAAPVQPLIDVAGTQRLPVDEFLRLSGHTNVFVAGSAGDYRELGADHLDFSLANRTGHAAAENLIAATTGRSPVPLEPGESSVAVSLGRRQAAFSSRGLLLTGRTASAAYQLALAREAPSFLKSASLLGEALGKAFGSERRGR